MQAQVLHRWLEAQDGPAVLRVHRRAILLEGVRAYSPVMVRSWADGMDADYHARALNSGESIELAELHGAVVAFCGVIGNEIRGLFVDPGFARRGLGRGLVLRALERMRGAGHGEARVDAALSGVGFYEAMGFRKLRGVRHPTRGGLSVPMLEMARGLEPGPTEPSAGAPGPLTLVALRSAGAV